MSSNRMWIYIGDVIYLSLVLEAVCDANDAGVLQFAENFYLP